MKFYHSTQTCSTVSHIILEETGHAYTPVEISWKRNLNVDALAKVNPLGAVPVLELDDGRILTQNPTILEYLADAKPETQLLAKAGTKERLETTSWLVFASADFQKAYTPYFVANRLTTEDPLAKKELRDYAIKNITKYLDYVEANLAGKEYIVGNKFSVADAALFVFIGWTSWVEVKTAPYKNISAYMKRIYARPHVKKVLEREELLNFIQQ